MAGRWPELLARRKSVTAVAAALLLLAALPHIIPMFHVYVATDILIFALFATSLNLVLGYGGMVSFGHAAYFGISAYTAALLVTKAGFSMPAAMIAGPLMAALAGLIFGFFCVRLTSIYFAMLTLAFAQAVYTIIFQWYSLTQGDTGIIGVWPPEALLHPTSYFYFTAAIVVVSLLILYRVVHSPFGYTLSATRENPRRSRLLGINVRQQQLLGLIISAFFSGVAGALFVFERGGAYPEYAAIDMSIKPLVMTMIGGMGHFLGPLAGSVIMTFLEVTITKYTDYWQWVLGLVLIATIVLFPQGLLGTATGERREAAWRRLLGTVPGQEGSRLDVDRA